MKTRARRDNYACLVPDSFGLPATGSGRLDGTSFALKDMVAINGHTPSFGHPRWRETHPKSLTTAPFLERLLNQGATMGGLVKLDQLAFSLIGNVSEGRAPFNPLYRDRWPGGSSSGTAVSVAGGLVDFGVGSDTAGSNRVPAAACGIYSLRPTYGRINSEGMIILSPSMDVVGLMAREPELMKRVFKSLAAQAPQPSQPITKLLVPTNLADLGAPPVVEGVLQAVGRLAKAGLSVELVSQEIFTTPDAANLMAAIHCREIWQRFGRWFSNNMDYFDPDVRARIEQTADVARVATKVRRANQASWQEYRQQYAEALPSNAAVVIPALPNLMPRRTSSQRSLLKFRASTMRLTAASSLTGFPQVVAPIHGKQHVYGMGLIGAPGQDEALMDTLQLMDS